MLHADSALCRIVYREAYRGTEILAHLTRFGGLAVFVINPTFDTIWQGDNILAARDFVMAHCDDARRIAKVARARHDRFAFWHAFAKAARLDPRLQRTL